MTTPAAAAAEIFDRLTAKRRDLEGLITSAAIQIVHDWMADNGLAEIGVDDGHERPSYAVIDGEMCDDDTINDAISWLPPTLIANSTPAGGWNPLVRIADLAARLDPTVRPGT